MVSPMKLIDAKYEIITFDPFIDAHDICMGYTTCYDSPMPESFQERCNFIRKHRHHESQLEHSRLSVRFTINRAIANEIVRHRHCAFGQQSTRYCNYSKDRFDNQITFVNDISEVKDSESYKLWLDGLDHAEQTYLKRLELGDKPEQARGNLPNDTATKLFITTNYREWRSIFKLRCESHAHYQMRQVMVPLYDEVNSLMPCAFDDIYFEVHAD